MKFEKYKITGAFGLRNEGDVIDTIILNVDTDSGIALCFHPAKCGECGSFELVKKDKKSFWISAFGERAYSNAIKTDKEFKKFLKMRSKKNVL